MPHNPFRTIAHPGEILKQDFLDPMGMSVESLARAMDIPRVFISEIVKGQRDISADMATHLGMYFKGTAESWMNLQRIYDGAGKPN